MNNHEILEKRDNLKDAIIMGEFVLKLGEVAKTRLNLQGGANQEVKLMKEKVDNLFEAEIEKGHLKEESRPGIYQHFGKIIKLIVSKNGEKSYQQATQAIKEMVTNHKKELNKLEENLSSL